MNLDKPFVFVKPGGNHGDQLIYFGMEQLADSLGIDYTSLTADQFLRGDVDRNQVVYLHGGGGFNQWCSQRAISILNHAITGAAQLVIQGPCTLDEDTEYLAKIGDLLEKNDNKCLIFFTREEVSYKLASKIFPSAGVQLHLDQDTAFWADLESLEQFSRDTAKYHYRLYALRQDNESSITPILDRGRGVQLDPAYYCRDFVHWVRIHLFAKEIITTRTHSAIIGALLKKPVILYPGRYHKNFSIWNHSLRHLGVRWGPDEHGIVYTGSNSISEKLPSFLRKSYKVNQFIRWAQHVPLR